MKFDNTKIMLIVIVSIVLLSLLSYYINDNYHKNKNLELINKTYGRDSFITVNGNLHGDKYNLTYGEMTHEGMKNIIKYCKNKNISHNTFIDLGCGNGRTLAYAINYGFNNAKGVEIVEKRYNYAVNAREKLNQEIKQKITLDNKDIFDLVPGYIPKNSVIFISNLLFPSETNNELIKHLSHIAPADVYIILSTLPGNMYDFKLLEQIDVPMSWNKYSTCHVLSR